MIKKQIIYHFENYIQTQKLTCISKLGFNRAEVTKAPHAVETKWDIRIYCQARIFTELRQRR